MTGAHAFRFPQPRATTCWTVFDWSNVQGSPCCSQIKRQSHQLVPPFASSSCLFITPPTLLTGALLLNHLTIVAAGKNASYTVRLQSSCLSTNSSPEHPHALIFWSSTKAVIVCTARWFDRHQTMHLVCSQVWCTPSSQLFSQVLVNRQGIPHHRRSFSQVQFARNCLVCKHSHMTDVTNVKLMDHHIAVSLLSHFFVFKKILYKNKWGANIIFSIVIRCGMILSFTTHTSLLSKIWDFPKNIVCLKDPFKPIHYNIGL